MSNHVAHRVSKNKGSELSLSTNGFTTGRGSMIKVSDFALKKASALFEDVYNNDPLPLLKNENNDFEFPPFNLSSSDINEVIDSVDTLICKSGSSYSPDFELSLSDNEQSDKKNNNQLNISDLLKDDFHFNEVLDKFEQKETVVQKSNAELKAAKNINQTIGFKSGLGKPIKPSEDAVKKAKSLFNDIIHEVPENNYMDVDLEIQSQEEEFLECISKVSEIISEKVEDAPKATVLKSNVLSPKNDLFSGGFKTALGNALNPSEKAVKFAKALFQDFQDDSLVENCRKSFEKPILNRQNVNSTFESNNCNFHDKSNPNEKSFAQESDTDNFKENISLPFSPIPKSTLKKSLSDKNMEKILPKRLSSSEVRHSTPKTINKASRDLGDKYGKRKRLGIGGLKLLEVSEESLNNAKKRLSSNDETIFLTDDELSLSKVKRTFNSDNNTGSDQRSTCSNVSKSFESSKFIFKPRSNPDLSKMQSDLQTEIQNAKFKMCIYQNRFDNLAMKQNFLQYSNTERKRPQMGCLLKAKLNRPHEHLKLNDLEFLNVQNKSHTKTEIPSCLLNLKPENAVNFHFIVEMSLPGTISVTSDNFVLIPNTENRIGLTEIELAFKTGQGVDSKLVPDNWVENHFKWIVWKLASYERMFQNLGPGQFLTLENVMAQLKYRYDREIDRSESSALRRILEKDELPSRRMVLCVAFIIKVNSQQYELTLTDGWYSIRTVIDSLLTTMINKKKIFSGLKLLIHSAELINCPNGCDVLKVPNDVRLKIFYNNTRRAAWHLKLGFQPKSHPFYVSLESIRSNNGPVGFINGLIIRVYPERFMEINGSHKIWRNEKSEESYRREWEAFKETKIEELNEQLIKALDKSRKNDLNNCDKISEIMCEKTLCQMIYNANDPESFKDNLSESQQKLALDYWPEFLLNLKTEMSSDFESLLENEGLNNKRNVASILTLRIVSASNGFTDFNKCNFLLTFWNFKNQFSISDVFREGQQVTFYNLVTKEHNVLSTTNYTKYTIEKLLCNFNGSRTLTCISDTLKTNFKTLFNEFDTVGILVKLDIQTSHQIVWLTDIYSNLLLIRVREGYRNCLLFNGLKVGDVVAAVNLISRKGVGMYGQGMANQLSIFTNCVMKTNSLNHLKEEFEKFEKFIVDFNIEEILNVCNRKINTVRHNISV